MGIVGANKMGVTRRDFLKGTVIAGLGLGAGATIDALLSSCTSVREEIRPEVENPQYDSNPIIPMIPGKIYTGTNSRMQIDVQQDWWLKTYGTTMTFHKPAWGALDAMNDMFPKEECQRDIQYGAIPVVNWALLPFDGFKPIAKGKLDDTVKRFAHQLAEFGHPLVLLPFEQPNEPYSRWKPWCCQPGSEYLDAWVHLWELCDAEGANKKTLWTTKLKFGRWPKFSFDDPFRYLPPRQHMDIIGWQFNNLNEPRIGLDSQSLRTMFSSYYNEAQRKYPTLPQAFWEFSSNQDPWQVKYLDDALTDVENRFPMVKVVMLDEIDIRRDDFAFIARLSPQSVNAVAKHFRNGKYIGSIIKN